MNIEIAASTANYLAPQTLGLSLATIDKQVEFAIEAGFKSEVWAPGPLPRLANAFAPEASLTEKSREHISSFHQGIRGESWIDPFIHLGKKDLDGAIWAMSALAFLTKGEDSLRWIYEHQQLLDIEVPVVLYEFPNMNDRPRFAQTELQLTVESLNAWPHIQNPLKFIETIQREHGTDQVCYDLAHIKRVCLLRGWTEADILNSLRDNITSLHLSIGRTDLKELNPVDETNLVRDLIGYAQHNRLRTPLIDQLENIRDHTNIRRVVLETRPEAIKAALDVPYLSQSDLQLAYSQMRESMMFIFEAVN